ncbi:MAG TPA: RnfABCDGE type electron transport complex subunit G [Desulfobacterales bacterium]|nr:RnfABCDGE type electron transport complex subunit G [Desulfobacterales bacterium]
MLEMVKMIIVLTILSTFSGTLLAALHNKTKDRIEYQQLKFVKGPAIREILKGSSNDPIIDRFKIKDGDMEKSFFIGVFDGEANSVVFETFGTGFQGQIGLMVGVNIKNDKIVGVGVTTHSETPGVGSLAKTDPIFVSQFKGLPIDQVFKVKADGGQIDAMSGATLTSRGVTTAATDGSKMYKRLKLQITENLKSLNK